MGGRGATSSSGSMKTTQQGLVDKEYASRFTKREGYTGGYNSRYKNQASFEYDGETFKVDKDRRGGTSADGKRSMMFPDEVLFARAGIASDYIQSVKSGGLVDPINTKRAKELLSTMKTDHNKLSNLADRRTSKNIINSLESAIKAKGNGRQVLSKLPKGWSVDKGATTAPRGYVWVSNGKSLFGGERKQALIPEELVRKKK